MHHGEQVMHNIAATVKLVTRSRPLPSAQAKPVEETLTTHVSMCPECNRETHVGIGPTAIVYGACKHFCGVQQTAAGVEVLFAGGELVSPGPRP